jgi:hypothetical protein
MPPRSFGLTPGSASAPSHYLGPSFAVLLFRSSCPGVAWFRIASARVCPFTTLANWREADRRTRRLLIGLGACPAVMNTSFISPRRTADEPGGGDGVRRDDLVPRSIDCERGAHNGARSRSCQFVSSTSDGPIYRSFWATVTPCFSAYIVLQGAEGGASGGVTRFGRRWPSRR